MASISATSNNELSTMAQHAGAKDLPEELARQLEGWFGLRFAIVDGDSGEALLADDEQPCADWGLRAELCRAVARARRPEIVAEEAPFFVLAIPFEAGNETAWVAVATILSRPIESDAEIQRASSIVGSDLAQVAGWSAQQPIWPVAMIEPIARLAMERWNTGRRVSRFMREIDGLSEQISLTYEEISLVYRLTQNLKLSRTSEDLGRLALCWLEDVVSAEGFALWLTPPSGTTQFGTDQPLAPVLLTHGDCPVDDAAIGRLLLHFGLDGHQQPLVANRPLTGKPDWPFPEIHELILVPLCEGDNLFGWLGAFNFAGQGEFGSVEANLMSTVASILGIHGGNAELYRQQAELLAGVIRALSSAIDAKDTYTCGHSDRVARIATSIGRELGLDSDTLRTLYLGGLLHDVGKIGVKDEVLSKPGRLTDEEFEHIKAHPEIGYRILRDLKKLDDVLPIVHHHHESWNGRGYPDGLAGGDIPFLARLVAVADAFDAMASDRPYRKGMDDQKLDGIFQGGAGTQWDPEIVAAMFRIRETVGDIAREISDQPVLELTHLP